MTDIHELTRLMAELGVAQASDLVGVTQKEIDSLQQHFGVSLPPSYRLFLLHMGRSAGQLSPWMAIYFDDLKEIREQFDLLNATLPAPFTLPPKSLIIANWESVFDYIVCTEDADPPVSRVELCNSGGPSAGTYTTSYSDYLRNLVRNANTHEIPADLLENENTTSLSDDLIVY